MLKREKYQAKDQRNPIIIERKRWKNENLFWLCLYSLRFVEVFFFSLSDILFLHFVYFAKSDSVVFQEQHTEWHTNGNIIERLSTAVRLVAKHPRNKYTINFRAYFQRNLLNLLRFLSQAKWSGAKWRVAHRKSFTFHINWSVWIELDV